KVNATFASAAVWPRSALSHTSRESFSPINILAMHRDLFAREELLGVLRPFENATPLPRSAFVEPEIFAAEERALFGSEWIPVAHEADVARPGDWVKAPLRGENLVVVR